MLESMLSGSHDEIDHVFSLDDEVFSKLFYLVDGIYPSLTRFLRAETDLDKKIDSCFKIQQEAHSIP